MSQAYVLITDQGDLTTILPLPSAADATVSTQDVIQATAGKRVLLHVHGGLVPRPAGLAAARRLSGHDGTEAARYPEHRADVQLYLVWPAGVLDAVQEALNDTVFGKVVEAVVKYFGQAQGGRGWKSITEPVDATSLERQYAAELRDMTTAEERKTSALVGTDLNGAEPGERGLTVLTLASIAVKATLAIFKRRGTNPDPYLFEAMVREEVLNASRLGGVGVTLWQKLKGNAVKHAEGDFLPFLQAVYDGCQDLTLVGHSTGANLITALIPALKVPAPEQKKLHVVFLAPAVTVKAFNAQLQVFGRHLPEPLRIYAMAHDVEIKDRIDLQGVNIYPGSLLQLVNFVFEDPRPEEILGLAHYAQRQHQNFGALVAITTAHDCTSHGGFDDNQTLLNLV